MTSKKVGIYAGTFDPVHEGHLAFARQALDTCGLSKIFFLVEPRPRRKQGVRALEHRRAMVSIAITDDTRLGSIVIGGQERFTVGETLPLLLKRFEGMELYLLLGEDVAVRLAEWPHAADLAQSVRLVIGLRNQSETEMEARMKALERQKGLVFKYSLVTTDSSKITSSDIRLRLKHNQPPQGLLPGTIEYIEANGLYAPSEE